MHKYSYMHISRQLGPRVNPHIVIPGLTGDLAVNYSTNNIPLIRSVLLLFDSSSACR